MNKFDKMKIVTKIEYIDILNYNLFQSITKFDEVLYYKYQQKTPYTLLIMVNFQHFEVVLEFTAKILKEHYPELINKETIRECLQNINNLGFCSLDIDAILKDSQIVKCDITKDIQADINLIKTTIKQNLSNYTKWVVKNFKNGIVLENVVSTPKYKKRLTIYNKEKELNKVNNINFINSIEDGNTIIDSYKSKVRFELNINTKQQIRQLLNIPNNDLQAVLESKSNPILSVIDEAIKFQPLQSRTKTLRDYERELLLEKCGFDLVKVEATVRSLINKNTSIKRAMQPYRDLIKLIKTTDVPTFDLRKLVS